KSPRFLYREVGSAPDAYDVAARLSFGLWDSLPDQELLDAAAAGKLATREQVTHQPERMLGDLRARAKIPGFFAQELKIDQVADLAKSPQRFLGFDPTVISDLRASLELFVEEAGVGPGSDFRQLLLADQLYLNARLAKFYKAEVPAEAGFHKVNLN